MLPSSQRSIQCVGTLLVMFSLGACGGLPKGGERPPSTAMKNNGGTALAAAVRPRVAAHLGQSGLHTLLDGREALAARVALADAGNAVSMCSISSGTRTWPARSFSNICSVRPTA